jgi:prophage antirepressor-like protein
MNELMIFTNPEFGNIRTIERDGTPWFVGKDVAEALGYAKPRNAIDTHVDPDDALKQGVTDSMGRTQEMTIINESGLYALVLGSKLPTAKKFKRWVTSEVLPSIRKNGMYLLPKDYPSALRALADSEEQRMALEASNATLAAENERQAQVIAEFEPIRQYVDTILESPDALATSQIAADYGMSAQQLNKILRDEGVQHKVNGQWLLYKKHMNKGYTKSKTFQFTHSDGRADTKLHTQWTQKGRLMIHNILEKRGIVAMMDRGRVS